MRNQNTRRRVIGHKYCVGENSESGQLVCFDGGKKGGVGLGWVGRQDGASKS